MIQREVFYKDIGDRRMVVGPSWYQTVLGDKSKRPDREKRVGKRKDLTGETESEWWF